jgi:uncharacterized protein YcbX
VAADGGTLLGDVGSLWRYPVKSMRGEEVARVEIGPDVGIGGDRAYGLVDVATGTVASAKHPRKWSRLLDWRADFDAAPALGSAPPPVRITLPDGMVVRSDDADVDAALSRALGCEVRLATSPPRQASLEESTLRADGTLPDELSVTPLAIGAPAGTFFDFAPVHLLTTATLARLETLHPAGRFALPRFRPNVVVRCDGADGFVENDWVGHELALGDEVRLCVTFTCPRCVMTTLPQQDLPSDPAILQTAARHNRVLFPLLGKAMPTVGVYATVVRGGRVQAGDRVRLLGRNTLRRTASFLRAIKRAAVRR